MLLEIFKTAMINCLNISYKMQRYFFNQKKSLTMVIG